MHSRGDSPLGDPQSAIDISHRIRYTSIWLMFYCFHVGKYTIVPWIHVEFDKWDDAVGGGESPRTMILDDFGSS